MLKYSIDDEDFQYDSVLEAILDMDDPQVGDKYYSCQAVPLKTEDIVSKWAIESFLEQLDERLYDAIYCEDANPFSEVENENLDELRSIVADWAKKYTNVEKYWHFTSKSTTHFLTKEDLEELND
jgi:hypothetical protein